METPLQIQLTNEIKYFVARKELMDNSFLIGAERLKRCKEAKLHIEALILTAQIVEHYIKLILDGYASRRRVLELIGEKDIYASVILKTEEVPLGDSIGVLKKLGVDKNVINKLTELNNYRKDAVHHIFNGLKDIQKFEISAMEYMIKDMPELFKLLHGVQQKVSNDIQQFTIPYLTKTQ